MNTLLNRETIQMLGWGLKDNPSSWQGWAFVITGLIFIIITAVLIWLYFVFKGRSERLREYTKEQGKSLGSFKGFWGTYSGAIVLFLSIVFLILGIYFIWMGINGTLVESTIETFSLL